MTSIYSFRNEIVAVFMRLARKLLWALWLFSKFAFSFIIKKKKNKPIRFSIEFESKVSGKQSENKWSWRKLAGIEQMKWVCCEWRKNLRQMKTPGIFYPLSKTCHFEWIYVLIKLLLYTLVSYFRAQLTCKCIWTLEAGLPTRYSPEVSQLVINEKDVGKTWKASSKCIEFVMSQASDS